MDDTMFMPHFTPLEAIHRRVIKHLPGKMLLFDRFQKAADYTRHVPMFYTLLTPLFQIIYGSNNIHGGYYETGLENWPEAQHKATRLLGENIGLQAGHRVLEVGCGIGGPAVTMSRAFGCHVTGLNITRAHIRRAKKFVRYNDIEDRVSFEWGNALAMPFKEPRFDHAYAIESVSHMPDKARVIREVARVTRPGARFGILDACAEDARALAKYPGYNFFNVTWGVRADEWIKPGEIAHGFDRHGFKLLEERDLSDRMEAAPMVQAEYARKRKRLIVDLYGQEVFDVTIKALEVASDLVRKRLFTMKLWVGVKEDGAA